MNFTKILKGLFFTSFLMVFTSGCDSLFGGGDSDALTLDEFLDVYCEDNPGNSNC